MTPQVTMKGHAPPLPLTNISLVIAIDGTAKWLVGPSTVGPFNRRRQSNYCHHAAQIDFSLFVLELPLPNRKAEVIFPLFVLELLLPNPKSEVKVLLFVMQPPLPNRKAKVELLAI